MDPVSVSVSVQQSQPVFPQGERDSLSKNLMSRIATLTERFQTASIAAAQSSDQLTTRQREIRELREEQEKGFYPAFFPNSYAHQADELAETLKDLQGENDKSLVELDSARDELYLGLAKLETHKKFVALLSPTGDEEEGMKKYMSLPVMTEEQAEAAIIDPNSLLMNSRGTLPYVARGVDKYGREFLVAIYRDKNPYYGNEIQNIYIRNKGVGIEKVCYDLGRTHCNHAIDGFDIYGLMLNRSDDAAKKDPIIENYKKVYVQCHNAFKENVL